MTEEWGGLKLKTKQAINHLKGVVSILSHFKSVLCLCRLHNFFVNILKWKYGTFCSPHKVENKCDCLPECVFETEYIGSAIKRSSEFIYSILYLFLLGNQINI